MGEGMERNEEISIVYNVLYTLSTVQLMAGD